MVHVIVVMIMMIMISSTMSIGSLNAGDDENTEQVKEQLPASVTWDGELFDDDFGGSDVHKRAGSEAVANNVHDVTS